MTDEYVRNAREELGLVEVPPPNLSSVQRRAAQMRARRYLWMGVSLIVAIGGVAATLATFDSRSAPGIVEGSRPNGGEGLRGASAEEWRTVRSDEKRFTIEVPSEWTATTSALVPAVTDPVELVTAGTPAKFLSGSPDGCPSYLEEIGPTDVVLTISEPSGELSGPTLVQGRAITLSDGYASDLGECLESSPVFAERMIPFKLGDRYFFAHVIVGSAANPSETERLVRTLNSFATF